MACIQMPILVPFAVRVQQSKKQQVSNCCVLKIKASWRMMRKKNLMKTKTWMLIYKTDTTQDLTVKKSVTAADQTTHYRMRSEAALWSSFWRTYLWVSQRLWASDRTFFHYLGLQRLWIRQKESRRERREQIILRFQMHTVSLQCILSWTRGAHF